MLKDYVKCGKMHRSGSVTTIGTSPGGYTRSIHDREEGATYFGGLKIYTWGIFGRSRGMSHFFLGLLKKIHVHFWVYVSQSDEDLCVNVEHKGR